MKKIKNLLVSFLVAACAVCLSLAFVACSGGDKSESKYGYGEEGVYYYSADADTDYLMTLQSGTYMISLKGVDGYSGTYSYDTEAGTVSFKSDDGETFEASFADDAMQLAISGQPYTFLKKVDYSVKFVDGSSTIDTQSVTYGKSAEAIDGEKSGYIFIGWFEDAAFTTKYTFDTAVTGDVTLYAYYIEEDSTISNFDITYISDGKVVGTAKTQNGMVLEREMPEVEGILGWWVSDTNNEGELTYKYDGRVLDEATNLYAVGDTALGASVYDDEITWSGSVSSVTITVDGAAPVSATGNSYSYSFKSLSTGRHEIEISASGYGTETLVYIANGLARVSNFAVYGTTLVYNKVENAQYYYISVTCANPAHEHTMVYNGNTLTYDFSNCEMGPDGITFTVYAYGTGYLESVSETYVYRLVLDGVEVSVDASTDTAIWAPMENATGYEIYVNGEYVATLTATEYSLKNYERGTITVSVKPVAPGYYSEESEAVSYTKATLPAPVITGIDEYTVSWSKVDGATNYVIYVNGKQVETVSSDITSYALATDDDFVKADSYVITIKATNSSDANQNSQESDPVYATNDTMSPLLVYENGTVYWQYAMAVGTYYVSVNDGDETEVYGKNSFDVTFTQSGENVIKVYFKTDSGNSAVASLSVTAYAVIFDTRGGNDIDTIYVAKGDTLNLATPDFPEGDADFAGWYTLPDLIGDYDSEIYLGDGYLVGNGTTFTGSSTLILYASWLSVKYSVHLEPGMGYVLDEDGNDVESRLVAKNSTTFDLPVPVSDDTTYMFYGWYSGENGTGTRYTDGDGNAIHVFDITSETTLYAYWRQVISMTVTTYQGQDVAAASAGEAIGEVTEITIPATYTLNGREYSVGVIDSDAFGGCDSLVTINIPDTVAYISIYNNGYDVGGGAFAGSGALEAVNIYVTGDEPDSAREITYYSADGVLYRYAGIYGYVELLYFPQGKTAATFTVPSEVSNMYEYDVYGNPVTRKVESIAIQAFKDKEVTEIVLPSTIRNIDTQAFNYSKAEKITFSTDTDEELVIGTYAFSRSTSLKDITLPSNLASFSDSWFSYCSSLENIYIAGSTGAYSSRGGILCMSGNTEIIYYPQARTGDYTVPEGVTVIGDSAFANCTGLTGVTIAGSVETVEEYAFYYCTAMRTLTFVGNTERDLKIESYAFYYCTSLTEVEFPTNLVGLAKYSFGGCYNLTTVTYDCRNGTTSEDLAGLESYAFSTVLSTSPSSYVEVLNLGANVPAIDFANIFGRNNLREIDVDSENESYTSIAGVVYDKDVTSIYYFPLAYVGVFELPDTITNIPESTFYNCTNLTGITIPATVTQIGDSAFYNCRLLVTVTFEKLSDEDIADGATETSLTIGNDVFGSCRSLVSITLPSRLISLGTGVFTSCTSLEEIIIEDGCEFYKSYMGILYETDQTGVATRLVVCPINNKVADVVIYSTITEIDASAFANNASVKTIKFDGEVDASTFTIGQGTFSSCTALEEITLPEGLETIPVRAFYNCVSLVTVNIPSTVTTIGTSAFQYCDNLETVYFEGDEERTSENKLTISDANTASSTEVAGAFQWCISLKYINLPAYTYIGNYAFYECTALEEIVIPEGTGELRSSTFYGCSSLKSVTIGKDVTIIRQSVFYDCVSLEEITLPEGLYDVQSNAFYNCGIKKLSMPATLTSLTTTSFAECHSLEEIYVADGNTKFAADGYVLYELTNGVKTGLYIYPGSRVETSITVPDTVTTVYAYAFEGSNVQNVTFEDTASGTLTINSSTSSRSPFYNCSDLNKVVLPEGITTMTLFYNTSVKSVTVPSTVTSVPLTTFSGCTKLEEVIFRDGGTASLTFDGTGTSSSSTFYNCQSLTEISIPDRATNLTTYMFNKCSALETVTIGSGMTSISNYAFYNCTSLKTVDFGQNSSVTTIGQYSFSYTGPVTGIVLPSGVTTIDKYAFAYSEITDITMNDGLTTIGDYAFQYCSSLGSVTIPSTVTSTGTSTFLQCKGLRELTFAAGGEAALSLGTTSFQYCTALTSVTLPARLTAIGQQAFSYCSALASVTFEADSNLSSIVKQAFEYSGLTAFAFPESSSAISLGDNIFTNCYYLKDLTISSSVTSLGSALDGCYSIMQISVDGNSTAYAVDDDQPILYNYEKTKIIRVFGAVAGAYEIPEGVTGIDAYAFQKQCLLTEIAIPAGVTSIGNYAFDGCTDLEKVTIAAGARIELGTYVFQNCKLLTYVDAGCFTSCGNYAFSGCTSLKSVDCGNMTSFGTYAFSGCSALESITLCDTLTTISERMFQNCTSLKNITLPGTVTTVNTYAFYGCTAIVSIDCGSVTTFGTYAFSGCSALENVTLSNALTALANYMFQSCTSLRSIYLPDSVTYMGTYTFSGCSALESITIPEGVEKMGTSSGTAATTTADIYTFQNCTSLKTAVLPSGLANIGGRAFVGCTSLSVITYTGDTAYNARADYSATGYVAFPETLTIISRYTFDNCGIVELTVPASVTSWGTYAFAENTALTSVKFEEGATTGANMFRACTALESVDLAAVTTLTSTYMFYGCSRLSDVEWPSAVTSIPNYTFYNCSSLYDWSAFSGVTTIGTYAFVGCGFESVDLSGVTTITISSNASYAFQNCKSLQNVVWSDTVDTVGDYMFYGCSSLRTISLPSYVTTIKQYAFRDCTALVSIDLSNITTLGNYAFYGCTSLVDVNLGEHLTSVPNYAFRGCTALEEITITSSITSINTGSFYECTALESVTFIGGVTSIGENAFYGCTSLKEIEFPSSLKTITYRAFYGSGLEYVYIPASVTSISSYVPSSSDSASSYECYAFGGCANLMSFEVDENNTTYRSGESGELIKISDNSLMQWPTGYVGVANVEEGMTIGAFAFYGCEYVTEVVIPYGNTTVNTFTFAYTTSLEKVEIPSTVTSIGMGAFYYSGIETLEIPESVTSIGKWAFQYSEIKNIVTPETLTSISDYSFGYSALETIEIKGNLSSLSTYVFTECHNLRSVVFSGTPTFATLSAQVFYNCYSLTSFVIPDSVTTINDQAFEYSGLEGTLVIPEGVTFIGQYAFSYTNIEELDFRATEANLGVSSSSSGTSSYAFAFCSSLEKVTIAEGVTHFTIKSGGSNSNYVFRNDTALKEVNLPSTFDVVNNYMFQNCSGLESLVLPDSVTEIGSSAFNGCTSLSSFTFGNNAMTTVGSSAFADCTSLKNFYIPSNVTSVASSAFNGWTAEQTLYIGIERYYVNAWWTSGWDTGCGATIVYGYGA